MCATCFLIVFAEAFIDVLASALVVCILVRVLLSWLPNIRLPLGLADLVFGVSETVLGPIRRVLPFMGGLDLSPFIAVLLINFAQGLLKALLPPPL